MKSLERMKFGIMLIALVALASCKKVDASKGKTEDHVVNETGFTAIDFGLSGDLTFTESNTTSIIITTTQKVYNAIDIEVDNSVLKIKRKKGYVIKNGEDIKVSISAPNINSIACSGSGNAEVTMTEPEAKPSLNLTVSGSGSMTAYDLNAIDQKLIMSGSGRISVNELMATNCEATISGSGRIGINAGTVTDSEITISGSGNYDGFNFIAKNVNVVISGSGSANVYASDILNVIISGSGNVTYKGNPLIDMSGSGSGSLVNGN